MVAETIQTSQEAVLNAAEEVVTRAAMEASLGELTDRPKELYLRASRSWWGRDARPAAQVNSNVVWCRDKR